MNTIGISGLHHSVDFKKREFPNLSSRSYRIAQGFDSAAALVAGGEIVAAAAEERFSGQKATGAFPAQAIRYCLEAGRLRPEQVDHIAHGFSYEPFKEFFNEDDYRRRQYAEVYAPDAQKALLEQHFPGTGWGAKFVPVPHHLAHAASAFYPSGFDEALILVSDGMGEIHSLTVAVGKGADIRVLQQIPALHSLGTLYGVFTLYLGFYMGLDEYKVMGLAPYGNPRRYYHRLLEFIKFKNDGTYAIPVFARDQTLADRENHTGVLRFLEEQFGPARKPDSEITAEHQDLAAALQAALQTCQMHVLRHFKRQTGLVNLCLAGGVALNCSANGVIKRSRLFRQMFVQPAAGDDGTALGAALYVQHQRDPACNPHRMTVPLWGPEFDDEQIAQAIAARADCHAVKHDSFERLSQDIAARVGRGEIVAWFQGRMEFGPRALGSRSILADPRDHAMRERINRLVKKREAFRPFAPVVTREAAARIFDLPAGEEDTFAHMLYVMSVRPGFREQLPAITHVDGSARAQTVAREHNPRLWQLLVEFEKVSGLPVLLNTSFNVKGQPIVCTPKEALETFLFAGLDVLVMGDYVVTARGANKDAPPPTTLG
ncbi:MAG: carbamoyltransferase [Verrucomicrobia bacterium]|nr:carbamoyltransferase [Verrucomicrobiota bacterium]